MKIHLATDHAGLDLKNSIKNYLLQKKYFVSDLKPILFESFRQN